MNFIHQFVRLKSIDQIRAEQHLPIDYRGCPVDSVSMMRPFFGDGKIYYVTASSGRFLYEDVCTGSVKISQRVRLAEVELDEEGYAVAANENSAVNAFGWSVLALETVPNIQIRFPYQKGDLVYVNFESLINNIGSDALSFYTEPCTVDDVDFVNGMLSISVESGECTVCRIQDVLGRVTEMERPTRRPLSLHRCSKCGTRFVTFDDEGVEEADEDLCPDCRKRFFVTPYHRCVPPLHFWSTEDPSDKNNLLYYGFELEIDEGGEKSSIAEEVVKRMNPDADNPNHRWFMYCSHDGSLHNGMELISMPATLAYHHALRPKYAELFNWLKSKGYRSHNTTTCGLHFHFSRAFYEATGSDEYCIIKLLYLVEHFWDDLVVFSRRDYGTLARYARKMDCDATEFFDRWNQKHDHDGHYFSVNLTNDTTIELRMFRGTLNIDTFFATLDLVDHLVHLAASKSSAELQRLTFKDVLPESAKPYYQSRHAMSLFED